jgi:uncharacterized protein (TIGR03067 family)
MNALWLLLGFVSVGSHADLDARAIQGIWQPTALENDGSVVAKDRLRQCRLDIKEEHLSSREADRLLQSATFQLTPGADPPAIDLTATTGPNRGKVIRGIYRLDGDRLVLCLGEPGQARPREFRSPAGSGHALIILKRVKS